MEILFISHKYPPSIGGMQKQSYELIEGIRKLTKIHTLLYKEEGSKIIFFIKLKQRIKRILASNPKIGAIHLNDGSISVFCTWLPNYTKIPVYITLHGLDVVFPSRLYQKYIFPRFNRYHGLLCVSESTKNECLKRGIKSNKLSVIHNGVDVNIVETPFNDKFKRNFLKKHNISAGEKILISIGRPVKRKGFSWFIQSVLPHLDNVRYIIVGPYSDKDKNIQLALKFFPKKIKSKINLLFGLSNDGDLISKLKKTNNINNKFITTGKVSYEEKIQILKMADIFLMPNIKVEGDIEGFGLVALEASELGIPVLASGIEGITDAIRHNKNGFLVPSKNQRFWIHRIKKILFNPAQTKEISLQFQSFTRSQYSWDKMAKSYFNLFLQQQNSHLKRKIV